MDWQNKLSDLILGGLASTLGPVLPEHWRRRARERLGDFNPYNVIAGNHDLMCAVRLAWVRAAFDVLEAGRESVERMPAAARSEFNQSDIVRFEALARGKLEKIRFDALDRRTDPGDSPIDRHVERIMRGTLEYIAPGEQRTLDQSLTEEFNATLAALTGWPLGEIPLIFGRIAHDGLPTIDRGATRNFGELVFAAFAESLKNPTIYPEAAAAFNIAMQDAARKLSEAILEQIKGSDAKLDALIARADAWQVFQAGADAWQVFQAGADEYLALLPKLLEGQARIEAIVSSISSGIRSIRNDTQAIKGDTQEIKELLQTIQITAQSDPAASEEAINTQYQKLVEHLDREEFEQVLTYKPRNLEAYRAHCIARWSQKRYAIDKQFTPLTLLLDQGEDSQGERYQKDREFNDLRDVLKAVDQNQDRVVVVTGAPGSGKSTLLRRLELDLASAALRSGNADDPLTLFLPLNAYGQRGSTIPDPAEWVAKQWTDMTDGLSDVDALLRRPFVLLLDGLNEMPHGSGDDYGERLAAWKVYLDRLVRDYPKVRVVFSCRTLDYGSKLTTKELPRVPQVEVTPLTRGQVKDFLEIYSPQHASALWNQLDGSPQFDLYRSPYYLTLLIQQAGDGHIPKGRAGLFTGYVRTMLKREMIDAGNSRFKVDALLHPRDRERFGQWKNSYELPARGQLFKALAAFAFTLQERRESGDKSQVRIDYDAALNVLSAMDVPEELADNLLKAAADLQILDLPDDDVLFVHQLLQEYFAARHLAERIHADKNAEELAALCQLAAVPWLAADISPSVPELLQTLPKPGTLPDLPTTGWEETFLLAAAMVNEADSFLCTLRDFNLPLAGRCAAQADVAVSDDLCSELQQALVSRSRDPATDLRARISAGHALGLLGDPRFKRLQGPFGAYLLPPLVAIEGGVYAIGSDEGIDEDEAPRHEVSLASFSLGQFPVTNAEFRCFIEAGGYQDERWWETPAAQRWRRGEGTREGDRVYCRNLREQFRSKQNLLDCVAEEQALPEEVIQPWLDYCAMSNETFEKILEHQWPDQKFVLPEYWDDPIYNAPGQPVVGVCWFEVRAYCAWLSAQTNQLFRLPAEAEWEVAARGPEGRRYAWGNDFDATHCNALDTKLRRTTPIGVFPDGDAPLKLSAAMQQEKVPLSDLTGNVSEWTGSVYKPYPYRTMDERDNVSTDVIRVVRGSTWSSDPSYVFASMRIGFHPDFRVNDLGFRLLCLFPIE